MIITRMSVLTGIIHQMTIDVTKEDLLEWVNNAIPIQKVLAKLSAGEREFLISGSPPQEFDTMDVEWGIAEYIPEDLDSLIATLDEKHVPHVLEFIKKY